MANGATPPTFGAYLHAIEARGLTLLGDARGAQSALDSAQRSFDQAGGDEPDWNGYYGEADLVADIGQCLRDIGRPLQGLAMLEQTERSLPENRVTARAKTKIHIAAAYLALGEYEQADRITADALTAAGALSSVRTLERVKALQHRVSRLGEHRALSQLDERVTEFLRNGTAS